MDKEFQDRSEWMDDIRVAEVNREGCNVIGGEEWREGGGGGEEE
jgi:hypothetical protein